MRYILYYRATGRNSIWAKGTRWWVTKVYSCGGPGETPTLFTKCEADLWIHRTGKLNDYDFWEPVVEEVP